MAKDILKFLKVREVKSPTRGYPTDAGIDFYVPKFTSQFLKDLKEKNKDLFEENENVNFSGNINIMSSCNSITFSNESSKTQVEYDLKDDNNSKIKFDDEKGLPYFLLSPHSRILIPSGIHSRMCKEGRALIASNKSGIASKHGIIFGAQVVDFSYQGEIHINVINASTKVVRIYEDMKLIQFLETPIFNSELNIYDRNSENGLEEFYSDMKKDRGAGGFGSTDKK